MDGTEEAATHFDATTSQDEESYDSDVSEVDEEDAQVIPDEADDVQIEALKSAGDDTLPDNKGQEATNKGMAIRLQSLVIRNQFESMITSHHLDLEMAWLVMTRTFLPLVKRPNTQGTTSPFIVSRELAGCFS